MPPAQLLHLRDRLVSWLPASTNAANYSKLPITRTSSSQLSYDSPAASPTSSHESQWQEYKEYARELLDNTTEFVKHRRPVTTTSAIAVVGLIALGSTVYFVKGSAGSYASYQGAILATDTEVCRDSTFNESGWIVQPKSISPHLYTNKKTPGSRSSEGSVRTLASQRDISQSCADLWISKGQLCESITSGESKVPEASVDGVWTFIEPTPHWALWEQVYSHEGVSGGDGEDKDAEALLLSHGTGVKHFRSYDEIRYSLRSAIKHLPFLDKLVLLATNLPSLAPEIADLEQGKTVSELISQGNEGDCRVTQVPEWLNVSAVGTSSVPSNDTRLQLVSYWDLFNPIASDSPQQELAWKQAALPSFNSHSIESQLNNVPSTADTLLYSNNDFYFGRPLAPADISSNLFGTVFRIYIGSWIEGANSEEEAMMIDGEGNARALPNTMRLVDQRFGKRARNYPEHISYPLSRGILDEITQIWGEEIQATAEVRFRGRGPEYWLPLLAMYYTIEKHREALLWSFFVARSDSDGSGYYSNTERDDILVALGGRREGGRLIFQNPRRGLSSEDTAALLKQAGVQEPLQTVYTWSSADGYPYVSPELEGTHLYPDYHAPANFDFCSIDIAECFMDGDFFDAPNPIASFFLRSPLLDNSVQDVFKNLAFDKPKQCGDCLIAALLAQSGDRGFEAFLPPPADNDDVADEEKNFTQETVPQIGGGVGAKSWRETDFSLAASIGKGLFSSTWGKRDFCVRLIQRYAWTIGTSPTAFNELGDQPGWASWFLWRMKEDSAAFMGVNDHTTTTNTTTLKEIRQIFMNWQQKMFPDPSEFELRKPAGDGSNP